jgi:hypothetical protein
MKLPKSVQPHTVTIKPYLGDGAYGPQYDDEFESTGYFVQKESLTRDDEGNEVVSSSQYHTSDDIELKQQSELTFNGKTETVVTTNKYYNAFTGKLSNVEVMLK